MRTKFSGLAACRFIHSIKRSRLRTEVFMEWGELYENSTFWVYLPSETILFLLGPDGRRPLMVALREELESVILTV